MAPTRSFTELHKANIRLAAKQRVDEQTVGNYIRRSNSALFAQLLLEAQRPRSPALNALANALDPGQAPSQPSPTRIQAGSGSSEKLTQPVRKPPPLMDIT